jgi:phenylacetic acid degradation operon negative regulatory protein
MKRLMPPRAGSRTAKFCRVTTSGGVQRGGQSGRQRGGQSGRQGGGPGGGQAADPLAAQPRALIVTVYGLYARETGGWLSVATLIRLLAELEVDEQAVRSAISRLKQRGLVEPRRGGGSAGYGLTPRGSRILAEGDRRIFSRPPASSADGWVLAVFSVPEQQRAKRHALRSRLAWLGFGTVSAGVWIAPRQLAGETRDVLDSDGLSGYVSLFAADYLAFGDVRSEVGNWWDLGRLEQLYQAFIASAAPVLARWEGREGREGRDGAGPAGNSTAEAFADYVRVLTAWRRLPFLDPGLPLELLPEHWDGHRAAELFGRLRDLLGGPAREHVLAVAGGPAG